ncbi:response regulator transcription factor [Paenibacillus fonticola]|uniref:response regulator transcription factor n=1 Tax=Paenibacillus fonticola TaxID=379896 RepID=UPI00037D73A6|nr:helix-turn-helix domain-containing protein [Paenibacillus fonticola]
MYRLLIVDDEEIITDSLYEVFHQLMSNQLDICKAYSGKEALDWLSRTRIDIVLTDIRMPGIGGLELSEYIRLHWPRCRIIFLTGYGEFDYAYKAIQIPNVRYILKTEGYDKVTDTVSEVVGEIQQGNKMLDLLQQSNEQYAALKMMTQGDYIRYLLQDGSILFDEPELLGKEFGKLHIDLEPKHKVLLVLGRIAFNSGTTYTERSEASAAARFIWNSFLSEHTRSVGIVDKQGDMLWFIQPSSLASKEKPGSPLLRYVEGTLELIQEAMLSSLGLSIAFTISGASCEWRHVTQQYERLRQLQQLKFGDGISMILKDHTEMLDLSTDKEGGMMAHKAAMLESHLEAGRAAEFFAELGEISDSVMYDKGSVQRSIEAYYSIGLVLLSYINRTGIHGQVDDYSKLMRLDDHSTIREGFRYLLQIAESVFRYKQLDERDRTTQVISRICQFIEEHISEDLSLVRLAEVHYFNPSYLSRFFKQECGINLSEYIDKCRIRKAKELLIGGDLKVREVAASVGYEASHSFTRFFKKMTGLTPQEYREALLEK